MRTRVLLFLMALFMVLAGCQQKPAADAEKTDKAAAAGEKAGEAGEAAKAEPTDPAAADKAAAEPAADKAAAEPAVDTAAAVAQLAAELPVGANPYLAFIPADTPYAWVTVSTLPWDKLPFDVESFGPLYEVLGAQLATDDSPPMKLAAAVLDEFKGNLTKEGLQSLGFATEAHMAIYGVGAFPVLRLQLTNGEAFEALVARVEAKVGVAAEKKDFNGTSYRIWNVDEVFFAAAIKADQLIVTMGHGKAADFVFPYAFGDKKPERSVLDSGAIAKLAQTYGKGDAVGVAFIDLLNLQQVLAGKAQNILSESLAAYGVAMPILEGDCANELETLAKAAPRLVYAGYMADNSMYMHLTLELANPVFASGLRGLAASVPGLGVKPAGTPLAAFGVGLDVKKTIDFLVATSTTMKAAPFKCEFLTDFNEAAGGADMLAGAPPFATALKGFNVVINNLDMAGGMPSNIEALAVIKTDKPAELWAQVQPLLGPAFASVALTANADPAALPAIPQLPMIEAPHIYMGDDVIALSIGAKSAGELAAFAKAAAPTASPLLVFGYDYARFFQLMNMAVPAGSPDRAMMDTMAKAYQAFGMGMMDISVSDQGLQFTYALSFAK